MQKHNAYIIRGFLFFASYGISATDLNVKKLSGLCYSTLALGPVKLGTPVDVEALRFAPEYYSILTQLQKFAVENKWTILLRKGNAEALKFFDGKDSRILPKSGKMPFKSATKGPYAGLVVEPRPDYFETPEQYQSAVKTWEANKKAWAPNNDRKNTEKYFYIDAHGVIRGRLANMSHSYKRDAQGLLRASSKTLIDGPAFHSDIDLFAVLDPQGNVISLGDGFDGESLEEFSALHTLNTATGHDPVNFSEWAFQHGAEINYKNFTQIYNPNSELYIVTPAGQVLSATADQAANYYPSIQRQIETQQRLRN